MRQRKWHCLGKAPGSQLSTEYGRTSVVLLCSDIEVQSAWSEKQRCCLPQLHLFSWKIITMPCWGLKVWFAECPPGSQWELLLSSTPSPCCCKQFCHTSQRYTGLAARERGCVQNLLSHGGFWHAAASSLSSPATWATLWLGKAQQLPWALSKAPALKSPFTL